MAQDPRDIVSIFPRIRVGGLPVATLNRKETAQLTIEAALSRRALGLPCLFFTTTNGQVVSLCASRPETKELFEAADLISPDGMSIVLASRLFSTQSLPERVATTDAFHDAAVVAQSRDASFFLLGGTDQSNALAAETVRALYPGLNICGRRSGYFQKNEETDVLDQINESQPDVLWVGLGVPAQQEFICKNMKRLTSVGVAKTCGGLFDFLSGKNQRAPEWMQDAGLEWACRMLSEPRRLGWRYLTTNPHAVYVMVRESTEGVPDGIIRRTVNQPAQAI